ncbi:MAG: sigma-70 family RNA polymerase sigma factor [Actinobacteria bacterium]|nr:sigma-70 family RNA polymerase sigma factor [Actinomycetota bacterium]
MPDTRDAAFATCVIPEIEILARVALSLTRNQADAEDLVQDTLMRAYKAIDRFDGRHPRAWLLTILRNTNINRATKRRVDVVPGAGAASLALARMPSADAGPEELTVERTFDAVIERELAALPGDMRAVIELIDMGGLSYQAAADALGAPVGTVMSRLHRARKRMRNGLVAAGVTAHRRRS